MDKTVDPIAQVCGVPAAEILARAAAHAEGEHVTPPSLLPELTTPPPPAGAPAATPPVLAPPQVAAWSLLDLGDGTREAFIAAAHQAILGRPAAPAELALRRAQLARGRTRLGIVLRLALSEEGRALSDQDGAAPPIRGPGLRAIHKLAPAIVRLARLPVLRAVQRRLRRRR